MSESQATAVQYWSPLVAILLENIKVPPTNNAMFYLTMSLWIRLITHAFQIACLCNVI